MIPRTNDHYQRLIKNYKFCDIRTGFLNESLPTLSKGFIKFIDKGNKVITVNKNKKSILVNREKVSFI